MSVLGCTINRYGRILIFRGRRKPECLEKTYQGGYGISKPNSHTTTDQLHWQNESVRALNPTCLATGVVCHPGTEQNRPYKIPWPSRDWNGDLLHHKQNFTSVPHYSIAVLCHSSRSEESGCLYTPVHIIESVKLTTCAWEWKRQ